MDKAFLFLVALVLFCFVVVTYVFPEHSMFFLSFNRKKRDFWKKLAEISRIESLSYYEAREIWFCLSEDERRDLLDDAVFHPHHPLQTRMPVQAYKNEIAFLSRRPLLSCVIDMWRTAELLEVFYRLDCLLKKNEANHV